MTDFTLRPLTVPERKYTYAQSSQLQGQTGNIGYLRGDFGSSGDQFYTTWFDTRPQWKSDEFKRDLDDVINALRSEEYGLLQSRSQMVRYGRENKESEMQGAYTTEFGFRADTEKYAFVLRCNPTRGDYNFYCLCYVKEWLDKHIEEANRDIRFIDSHYLDVGNYLEIKYPTLGVRFIAIQENVDTLKETGTEMMPFNNIFNEWYAAQTSKKIRAVWKNKAANGKRVSSSVPFGYLKNPQDKEDWLVDEPAADIVRKIYALCLDGRGPLQIAKQLEQEKVLIPSAYYASLGRKTRKQYTHPYAWDQKTVAGILANQQYTGCTVNFMTTTVSYKVHKTVYKPKDEWQIIPNTQPAIIDEDTWKRVQELRENRIRPTATGRTSLFSGKVFCADCGSKLHFCAAKSLNANQEHYRCANYKSGRGNCQIHYIRNVVLEKIVLEAINSLADFVRCYEPVFLYLMAQKDIVSKRTETNRLKSSIESGKRRIQDLDKLIERIYEDQVLGNISAERYARMSVNYENEQRELVKRVDEDEKRLVSIEQTSLDLKILLKVLRSSTAFEELTPTLVNSLIRRIEVHNNDKSSGHCSVKVDIYFTAIGLIDIPTKDEIKSLMEKIQSNPQEYRLTA